MAQNSHFFFSSLRYTCTASMMLVCSVAWFPGAPQRDQNVLLFVHHGKAGKAQTGRNKVHRASGIAQPAEDRCHDIIRRDAWNADKADDQVGTSARHGLLRCGDNAYDRVHKPYQHSCQYHRSCHKQRDCIANEPRRTRFVLCAHGPANSDRCSHGKAHDHHSDHMHHLTANGHRRCAGHTFKLPDDEQICHAVQRLQKIRKQIGQ